MTPAPQNSRLDPASGPPPAVSLDRTLNGGSTR